MGEQCYSYTYHLGLAGLAYKLIRSLSLLQVFQSDFSSDHLSYPILFLRYQKCEHGRNCLDTSNLIILGQLFESSDHSIPLICLQNVSELELGHCNSHLIIPSYIPFIHFQMVREFDQLP